MKNRASVMAACAVIFLLFSSFSVLVKGQIPTANNWNPPNSTGIYLGYPETGNGSWMLNGQGQRFSIRGGTVFFNNMNAIQSTWWKLIDFDVLDSMSLNFSTSGWRNVLKIYIVLAVEDSNTYISLGDWKEVNDSLDVKAISWDLSIVKQYGVTRARKVYLQFYCLRSDSGNVGANIDAFLLSTKNASNNIILDNFQLTSVNDDKTSTSMSFKLYQNYPNPFNPSTTIKFTINKKEKVSLTVLNLIGQEVKTLVDEEKEQGNYEVKFNASNLPSGIYFYRLQVGSLVKTNKMVFLK